MHKPARLSIGRPGLLTTVQDLGRFGFRRFGMPASGAMDLPALRLANRLVGNPDASAVLEMTIQGPELEFEHDAVIAITGADLSPAIDGAPVPNWTTLEIKNGRRLAFSTRRSGARAYLAIAGGFEVPMVLGSRSTHLRSQIGGFLGRALREGDELVAGIPPAGDHTRIGTTVPEEIRPIYKADPTVRIVLGPQLEHFTEDVVRTLTHNRYTISPQSDRMGYRLAGPPLAHSGTPDIVSDATPPGAIQVPASQQPILLMVECQTTGGYPKIGVVISVDLPLAAQLVPGDRLGFEVIGVAEAREVACRQRNRLDHAVPPLS